MSNNRKPSDIIRYRQYLIDKISKFRILLNLQNHTISIEQVDDDSDTYLECKFNYPYLDGVIAFSKRSMQDWLDGKNMEPVILHELCHLITDPLYAKATTRYIAKQDLEDERERLTDTIAKIVYSLL
jgi:hypothetical protein